MRYIVTGGLGFLGQYIVNEILANDREADILVVSRSKKKNLILNVLNDRRVKFHSCDLASENEFSFLKNYDYAIHNAAIVSFSSRNKEEMYKLNVGGTKKIIQACIKYKIKRLVYVSSISAVGVTWVKGKYSDETFFQDPNDKRVNDYSKSKALAEEILHKTAKGLDYVVGCPSIILGQGDLKLQRALKILRFMPIIPATDAMFSFVDVRDVARAFYFLLKNGKSKNRYLITLEPIPLIDFVRKVSKAIKKNKLVLKIPNFTQNLLIPPIKLYQQIFTKNPLVTVGHVYSGFVDKEFDNTKLKKSGFRYKYSLEQTIKWMVKNEKPGR